MSKKFDPGLMKKQKKLMKKLLGVPKQVQLILATPEVKEQLMVLVEDAHQDNPTFRLIVPPLHRYQVTSMMHSHTLNLRGVVISYL